jgi:hypothetical protein
VGVKFHSISSYLCSLFFKDLVHKFTSWGSRSEGKCSSFLHHGKQSGVALCDLPIFLGWGSIWWEVGNESASAPAPCSSPPACPTPRGRTKMGPWELPRACCRHPPHAPHVRQPPDDGASFGVVELRPPATRRRAGKPRARRSLRSMHSRLALVVGTGVGSGWWVNRSGTDGRWWDTGPA